MVVVLVGLSVTDPVTEGLLRIGILRRIWKVWKRRERCLKRQSACFLGFFKHFPLIQPRAYGTEGLASQMLATFSFVSIVWLRGASLHFVFRHLGNERIPRTVTIGFYTQTL